MDAKKVGAQIAYLRKQKEMTQAELGERLHVTFQAVSQWERGETLPDTAVLPDLARTLETTIDNILTYGQKAVEYTGRITVKQMKEGLLCLKHMGEYLGQENLIYRCAIEGINEKMNTEIEGAFSNERIFEVFVAEAIIQNLRAGKYIDLTDVRNSFQHEEYRQIVLDFCQQHGIK